MLVKAIALLLALTTGSFWAAAPAAASTHDVALRHIAEQLGYEYAYLGPQDAVTLSRPGVTILLRPGESTFDVNDRTETTAQAPHFYQNDLYISHDLANQLAEIANRYPRTEHANVVVRQQGMQAPAAGPDSASGAISLEVRQVLGSESVAVSGTAPPSVPVLVTLLGTVSSDVPDIVVGRHEIATGADGRFSAVVPIAPDYFHGSILTLVATSVPGVREARAQIVFGQPNGGVTVPAEIVPPGVR
jgi:hypothetical protein